MFVVQRDLRPDVFLIHTTASHALDNLFGFFIIDASLLSDDLTEDLVYLSRHVRSISTNVKVGLLLQEIVDKLAIFFDEVLYINLL